MLSTDASFPTYTELNGGPLQNGSIFFGASGQNPVTNPVTVYWDSAGTQPAAQPIKTANGMPSRNGAPARLWVNGDYSRLVQDSLGRQVLYELSVSPLSGGGGASAVGFIQAGVGAVARTMQDKGRDAFGVGDFATGTAAATAATALTSGGTVKVPNGGAPTLPASFPGVVFDYAGPNVPINVYAESGEATRQSQRVLRAQIAGAHPGIEHTLQHLELRPVGSGTNGPTQADYGLTVSVIKQGYLTSVVNGEVDGINVVVRNGTGDCAAVLGNIGVINGYGAFAEAITTQINSSGTVLKSIRTQIGVIDPVTPNYIGFLAIAGNDATAGSLGAAFQAQNTASATVWTNFLRYVSDNGSGLKEYFLVNGAGQIVMNSGGATTPLKTLRVGAGGAFEMVNNANSAVILSVSDTGSVNIPTGAILSVNNVGVVAARRTGWTAATGTSDRSAFDTATVTLPTLAAHVKVLLDDLFAHGLLGA